MNDQKSFVLYQDQWESFDKLTMEERGRLITAIFKHEIGEENEMDRITELCFVPIRQALDRNRDKYAEKVEKRREAGKLGGIAKGSKDKQKVAKIANAKFAKKKIANVADNENVNENENGNVNENDSENVNVITILSPNGERDEPVSPQYWNKEINEALEFLRKAVGVETFKESNQQQRNITKHVVNLSEKIGKDEFKERLKGILSDEFKAKNCNSINYLYRELKSYIVAPIVTPASKRPIPSFSSYESDSGIPSFTNF